MNVQADHLASDYLDNYAQPSKIIPFIQPSQANLTIDGETITEDMRIDCVKRPAALTRKDMCARNHWTTPDIQSIFWRFPEKLYP
jgi:hypothetical protein